ARGALAIEGRAPRWHFDVVCRDRHGSVKWLESFDNLVTTAGKNHLLDVAFKAGSQITSWYVGLISGSSPTIAGTDTLASHDGWTEFTDYDEATREALTLGTIANG